MASTESVGDLVEIVERLNTLTERLEGATGDPATSQSFYPSAVPAQVLETIYAARRLRTSVFGADADLFGEAAWDMLLDAAIMEARGKAVSVSSACLAADVPSTTALRYLAALEERDLVERQSDPLDNRKRYVRLTPKGRRLLRDYVAAVLDDRRAMTRV